jgi:glutaredoxin-related protein
MTDTEFNLEIAESLMLTWFDLFGMFQIIGDPEMDNALAQFRTWNTIFQTLEAM